MCAMVALKRGTIGKVEANFLARYITIHDDSIPYPIKEYTIPIEESGNYVRTVERVCEILYHIDDMAEDPSDAEDSFFDEEIA